MNFEVLIIGTDANAYYMARCYHECYNKKANVLGHSPLPFTAFSNILTVTYDSSIWEESGFLNAVRKFKKSIDDVPLILISSNETYAGFIANNRDQLLKEGFLFNYPKKEIINTLMYKDLFYKTYADSVLDLPKTFYYDCSKKAEIPNIFTFPVIVKPSNVIEYNHLSFEGKNKIYKVENFNELQQIVNRIISGGYQDCLILQDFIPGDDSYLFDAVAYSNSQGKVQVLSFAQIGLQEHSKSMVGNAAVLINGYNQYGGTEEVTEKLKSFLETIKYTGFAEFDLKYDKRDKTFKVLEINARQGRSSYYLTPIGNNLVQLLVDDLIEHKPKSYKLLKEELLLSFVSKRIIKKYIINKDYQKKALSLWKKEHISPVCYSADKSLKRKLYLIKRAFRYNREYKNSYWKAE